MASLLAAHTRSISIRTHARHATAATAVAGALTASWLLPGAYGWWLTVMGLCGAAAALIAPARPQLLVLNVQLVALAGLILAVGLSSTPEQAGLTGSYAVMMVTMLPVAFVQEKALRWGLMLAAVAVVGNAVMLVDDIGAGRAGGLFTNVNAAAGVSLALLAYLAASHKHAVVPAVVLGAVVVAATGSRGGLFAGTLLAMWFIARQVGWAYAIAGLVAMVVVTVGAARTLPELHQLRLSYTLEQIVGHMASRLTLPVLPSILPQGAIGTPWGPVNGQHNAYLRVATEAGIIPALGFGVIIAAAWDKHRSPAAFAFFLLALCGLLDFYIWMGQGALTWWALAAAALRHSPSR
jgi:hypothetical protein